MILGIADVYAQVPQRAAVQEALGELSRHARAQPGCDSYTCAEVVGDPGHFLLVQRWLNQRALNDHYRSEAFARYQGAVGAFLVRESELRLHVVEAEVHPVDAHELDLRQDD